MSIQVRRRREAASFLSSFAGAAAELIVDTTNNRLQVHDGSTPGGWPAAKLVETQTIGRTAVSDANYGILPSDVLVAVTALSASRTLTLPAASVYPVGRVLRILDESGAAAASPQIVVAAAGSDSIDGATSAVIQTPYGSLELISNGAGKWFRLQNVVAALGSLGALGINTAADPANPFSATLNAALFNALATTYGGAGDVRVKLNKQTAANDASLLFQDNFSGRVEIGLTGDDNLHVKVSADGATWIDALDVNAGSGLVTLAAGLRAPRINDGPLAGLRNRLINGDFAVNQRACATGVTLAAGAYGFDRWKAGAGAATLVFAAGAPDTMLRITAGSLVQIIEGANMEGGSYTLSWQGSAQARVFQGSASGSFAASPLTLSGLAPGADTSVEFGPGTLGQAQLEPGLVATPFERRPIGLELQLCLRYFQSSYDPGEAPGAPNVSPSLGVYIYGQNVSWATIASFVFPAPMRAHPTATIYSPKSGAGGSCYRNNLNVDAPAYVQGLSAVSCTLAVLNTSVSGEGIQANYTLDAEL